MDWGCDKGRDKGGKVERDVAHDGSDGRVDSHGCLRWLRGDWWGYLRIFLR